MFCGKDGFEIFYLVKQILQRSNADYILVIVILFEFFAIALDGPNPERAFCSSFPIQISTAIDTFSNSRDQWIYVPRVSFIHLDNYDCERDGSSINTTRMEIASRPSDDTD